MQKPHRQAILLSLLLLLAMLPVGAQSGVDVAARLSLGGPPPYWADGISHGTTIRVSVTNQGSQATTYTLSYYWHVADQNHYLRGSAQSSTDAPATPLQPDESRVHELAWTPLLTQTGDDEVIVVAKAGLSTSVERLPVAVPVHDLQVAWDDPSADGSIRVDETRFFRASILNLGNSQELLALRLAGQTPGLATRVEPASAALAPGGTQRVTFYVSWPFGSGPAPAASQYRLEATNASVPDWKESTGPRSIDPVAGSLPPGFLSTSVEPGTPPTAPAAGLPFQASFRVRNTGSGDDSFDFAADGPSGWGMRTDPMGIDLLPGESKEVLLLADVPASTPPGQAVSFTLHALSERGPSGDASGAVQVVSSGPIPRISAIEIPTPFYLGDEGAVRILLQNAGTEDLLAGVVDLSAEPQLPGLPAQLPAPAVQAGGGSTVTFPGLRAHRPSNQVTAAFGLAGPSGADGLYLLQRGEHASAILAGDLRIWAPDRHAGAAVLSGDADHLAGPVVPLPAALACIDVGRACKPGVPLYLDVATPLHQVGAGDLQLTGASVPRLLDDQDAEAGHPLTRAGLTMAVPAFADVDGDGAYAPGEAIFLDMDADGKAGQDDVRLTDGTLPMGSLVSPHDPDAGSHLLQDLAGLARPEGIQGPVVLTATWSAAGMQPSARTANLDVHAAGLRVLPPDPFEVPAAGRGDLLVPPGAFRLANTGNRPETFDLEASSSFGVLALPFSSITLGAGQVRTIPATFTLPAEAPGPWAQVRLGARLHAYPSTFVEAVTTASLLDVSSPSVAFVDPPTVWDPAHPLRLRISGHDDVGVHNVTLHLLGSPARSVLAVRSAPGEWQAEMELPAGNHTLRAVALDGAGRSAASDLSVRIATVPPPRIVGTSPADGSIAKTGQTVSLTVRDPLGISRAAARVDGVELMVDLKDIGNSTAVASAVLPNLAPGKHTVDLEAEDSAGLVARATLQITVLPPEVLPHAGSPTPTRSAASSSVAALAALAACALLRRRQFAA
ncbi:MAG TPA: hypothetical protein VM286_01590 [Candidatus Thermoplasmatota archaeon]|nr:hypothetical protein [Candidatus Thermoplasmatota archaeon]